jgi:fission 1 protein
LNPPKAKKFIDAILTKEPNNNQALELKALVDKKMLKEGLLGMALVGGGASLVLGFGALAVGAIAAAVITKRK